MKDTYIFPAVFEICDNGVSILFPDLEGCLPCAETVESAIKNAKEAESSSGSTSHRGQIYVTIIVLVLAAACTVFLIKKEKR